MSSLKDRHLDWWQGRGVLLGCWNGFHPASFPPYELDLPETLKERYVNANWRARSILHEFQHRIQPLDSLPVVGGDLGPGSLALLLGAKADFSENTVWFEPCYKDIGDVPELRFDPENAWFKIHMELLRELKKLAKGQAIVGCQDLVENFDVLASLLPGEDLLMAMLEEPELVKKRLAEIDQVYEDTYDRIYEEIQDEEGWSSWSAFNIYGPGKTAKVQCDGSAMFSPELYEKFVLPGLKRQCEYLDQSLYHLDGTQAICHLNHLISLKPLTAIQWTPQAGIEGGGNPRWFSMYRKILESGKSLQVGAKVHELDALFNAVGTQGLYIMLHCNNLEEFDQAQNILNKFKPLITLS